LEELVIMLNFNEYSVLEQAFIAWAFVWGTLFQWMMMGKAAFKFIGKCADKRREV